MQELGAKLLSLLISVPIALLFLFSLAAIKSKSFDAKNEETVMKLEDSVKLFLDEKFYSLMVYIQIAMMIGLILFGENRNKSTLFGMTVMDGFFMIEFIFIGIIILTTLRIYSRLFKKKNDK